MADALSRGLAESGQAFPPRGRLKPFINCGLSLRMQLREKTQDILDITLKNETSDPKIVGPLAMPAELISSARSEMRHFHFIPGLEASRRLGSLAEERLPVLDRVAAIGLAHLPEGLAKVNLAAFPEISDRAKIVRNMVASFVHRGNLCPLITTFDLRDFAKMSHDFSEERRISLFSLLDLKSPGERPFLDALFAQTSHAFLIIKEMPPAEDLEKTDYFYRHFSRELLLLHPALEEPQIITDPWNWEVGRPTLWENAACFGQSKIPQPGLLIATLRQAMARKDSAAQDRLSAAIKHWKWYGREGHKQEQEIAELNVKVLYDKLVLRRVSKPNFPLPEEAYFLRSEKQHLVSRRANFLRREARHLGRMIQQLVSQVNEAKIYRKDLHRRYQENWPDLIPLPRSVFIERLREETKKIHGQDHFSRLELTGIEQFIHGDLLWFGEIIARHGFLVRAGAKEWLEQEIQRAELALAGAKEHPEGLVFPKETLSRAFDNLELTFSWLEESKLLKYLSRGLLSEYFQFWNKTLPVLRETKDFPSSHRLVQQLAPQILQERIKMLKVAVVALSKREELASLLKESHKRLDEFEKNPQEPLPAGAVWSKGEVQDYLAAMDCSDVLTAASAKDVDWNELENTAWEMRRHFYNFPSSILPKTIDNFSQLQVWLDWKISGVDALLDEGDFVRKSKERLGRELEAAKVLREHLDHLLIPPLGERLLKRDVFMRAWKMRVDLGYVLARRKKVTDESIAAQQLYQKVMREEFITTVDWRLKSQQATLAKVQARSLEEELVGKMRALDLVLVDFGAGTG